MAIEELCVDFEHLEKATSEDHHAWLGGACNRIYAFLEKAVTDCEVHGLAALAWALGRMAHINGLSLEVLLRLVTKAYEHSVAHEQSKKGGMN